MTAKRTAIAVLFVSLAAIALVWAWTMWPAQVDTITLVVALVAALAVLGRLLPSGFGRRP